MDYMDYTQKQSAPSLRKTDLALAVLFCAVLGIGCLTIIVRMGTRALMKLGLCPPSVVNVVFFDDDEIKKELIGETLPTVDWEELYPVSKETEDFYEGTIRFNRETEQMERARERAEREDREERQRREGSSKRLVFQIPALKATFDRIAQWPKDRLSVVLNHLFVKTARVFETVVGVVYWDAMCERLDNGHLADFKPKQDVSPHANSLLRFKEFLDQRGIPFLYVQAPMKIPPESPLNGTKDFSNQKIDDFLSLINEKIDCVDLRDEIKKDGLNHYDLFYVTDGHWTTEAGFWAAGKCAKKLNEVFQLGVDDEALNSENFNFEVIPDAFLGGYGKAVAVAALADMEDFVLITPKTDFSLEVEIYTLGNQLLRKAAGGFDVLLFPEHLQTQKTAMSDWAYMVYISAGYVNDFIKNNSAKNDLNILFIGASYTDIVEPFFVLCVKNLDGLNLYNFDGSLSAFIDAHDYDACVMLHVGYFTNDQFDFR